MANSNDNLIKQVDIQKIANEGTKIYEQVKTQYDPKEKGKFLAIEIDSRNMYLGATSADALESAREHHPDKIFFVMKVGYDAAETMVRSYLENRMNQ